MAIVTIQPYRNDYQWAHHAAHVTAGLWSIAVDWVHGEWKNRNSPSKYDICKHLTSISISEWSLHAHTTEEIAYDLVRKGGEVR